MKIIIIDDQEAPGETLKLAIEEGIPGTDVVLHTMFDTAFDLVQSAMPDIVVLDLYKDPTDAAPGDKIRIQIWDGHFCPLVIYTARPQAQHVAFAKHPFIKLSTKTGSHASDAEVVGHLKAFLPHVETLRNVRNQANKAISQSLKECSVVWRETEDKNIRAELIGRIAKRRVAASMDVSTNAESPLRAWEQYVYPSICESLLTGDILVTDNSTNLQPQNFRVVISPSCDLVPRKGCLACVLVATCEPVKTFLAAAQLAPDTKVETLQKRLPSYLTLDQISGVFCLPELPGILPVMAVNLKMLELVPIKDISLRENGECKYRRKASVDSPFRERISWAYMQTAGRPGLPDIDVVQMTNTLISNATASARTDN